MSFENAFCTAREIIFMNAKSFYLMLYTISRTWH